MRGTVKTEFTAIESNKQQIMNMPLLPYIPLQYIHLQHFMEVNNLMEDQVIHNFLCPLPLKEVLTMSIININLYKFNHMEKESMVVERLRALVSSVDQQRVQICQLK